MFTISGCSQRVWTLKICFFLVFTVFLQPPACWGIGPGASLIPTPKQVTWKDGRFVLDEKAQILIPPGATGEMKLAAAALARALEETAGRKIPVVEGDAAKERKGDFVLRPTSSDSEIGPEGYRLRIGADVVLEARGGQGLFYAVQTLRQIISKDGSVSLAYAEIRDWPSWGYRGVMLDPARNFMTMEFLKHQIDVLSSYKLNYFHLHLTDNQGWRPQIKAYPQLISEKHYNQEELKELVAYAKARFVTLVPELDMPGHATVFVEKMPDLGHGRSLSRYGQSMCLGNEKLYPTLETIWREMAAIFDGPYLHVGGDEVKDDLACSLCKSKWEEVRRRANPPGSLVAYFLERMDGIIKANGRQMVAWSVDKRHWAGVLPKDVVQMAWTTNPVKLARKGYPTINTFTKPLYFDLGHPMEAFLQWSPDEGASGPLPALLGAEGEAWHDANLGSEWEVLRHVGFYPRLLALAEQVWGPPGGAKHTDPAGFEKRLLDHKARFFQDAPFPYLPPGRDRCRHQK